MKTLNEGITKHIDDAEARKRDLQNEYDKAMRAHNDLIQKFKDDWRRQTDTYNSTIRERDNELKALEDELKRKTEAWNKE